MRLQAMGDGLSQLAVEVMVAHNPKVEW